MTADKPALVDTHAQDKPVPINWSPTPHSFCKVNWRLLTVNHVLYQFKKKHTHLEIWLIPVILNLNAPEITSTALNVRFTPVNSKCTQPVILYFLKWLISDTVRNTVVVSSGVRLMKSTNKTISHARIGGLPHCSCVRAVVFACVWCSLNKYLFTYAVHYSTQRNGISRTRRGVSQSNYTRTHTHVAWCHHYTETPIHCPVPWFICSYCTRVYYMIHNFAGGNRFALSFDTIVIPIRL